MKFKTHISILKTVSMQHEGKRPLERPMCRDEANIKVNLKEWISRKQNEII
jgi:hypothetical protein